MATLEYTYLDYYKRVSRYLGTGAAPTGDKKIDAQDLVHRAYRRFLYPVVPVGNSLRLHTWSFLSKAASFIVSNGVHIYAMPVDFGNIETVFTYTQQDRALVCALIKIDEGSMLQKLAFNDTVGEPQFFCIRQKQYNAQTGQIHEVLFYPIPNGTYTYAYSYNINPPKMINDNDVPISGIECCECLMQMCLAAAELQEDRTTGVQEKKAQELLIAAIKADIERYASDTVGSNEDGSVSPLIKLPPGALTGDPRVRGFNVSPP